jgi:hypothetical protein
MVASKSTSPPYSAARAGRVAGSYSPGFGQPAEQLFKSAWCDQLQHGSCPSAAFQKVCQCPRGLHTRSPALTITSSASQIILAAVSAAAGWRRRRVPLWARGQRRASTSGVRQDVARGEMNAVGTEMQKMSAKRGCVPRPLHVPVRARPDGVARRPRAARPLGRVAAHSRFSDQLGKLLRRRCGCDSLACR